MCKKGNWRYYLFFGFVFCLIGGAVAGGLVAFLNTEFPLLKECVECFDEINAVGFNTTTATCLYSLNKTDIGNDTEAYLVTDSAFCGAPECQQLAFKGIRATPYWLMLVSIIAAMLQSSFMAILNMYLRECRGVEQEEYHFEQESEEYDRDQLARLSVVIKIVGITEWWWWVLVYMYSMAQFFYIIYEVHQDNELKTDWDRYEATYLLWLNSGTIQVVAVMFVKMPSANMFKRNKSIRGRLLFPLTQNGVSDFTMRLHLLLLIPLIPVAFTHMIPAFATFIPSIAAMAFTGLIGLVFIMAFTNRFFKKYVFEVSLLMGRLFGTFVMVIMIQTSVTYGARLYDGQQWQNVIADEYNSRSTYCYANALINNIAVYNVGIAGLILS